MLKMLSILVAAVAIGVGVIITYKLYAIPDLPVLDYNKWWGFGPKTTTEDTSIRPFKIVFDQSVSLLNVYLYSSHHKLSTLS